MFLHYVLENSLKNNRKSFISCETSNHQHALTKAFAPWRSPSSSQVADAFVRAAGLASSPWRKHLRPGRARAPPKSQMSCQVCRAWPARSDESICDLGVRAPPKSQTLSSGLPGLVSSPWRRRLRLGGGGRRSSQVAMLSSVLPGLVSSPCEPLIANVNKMNGLIDYWKFMKFDMNPAWSFRAHDLIDSELENDQIRDESSLEL